MNAQGIRCQLECVAENKGAIHASLAEMAHFVHIVDEIKFAPVEPGHL